MQLHIEFIDSSLFLFRIDFYGGTFASNPLPDADILRYSDKDVVSSQHKEHPYVGLVNCARMTVLEEGVGACTKHGGCPPPG